MKTLVTGASGFVGANLARRLLRDGHEVHLLLRPEYADWRIREIASECRLQIADICDEAAVLQAVNQVQPETIFHLCAYGAYSSQKSLNLALQTNVFGLSNLLNAAVAAGTETLINAGSSSEYGLKDHAPGEEEPVEPDSAYAISKVAATNLCRHVARSGRIHIKTLRLYSVYGPFEEPSRLIPTALIHAREGKLPPLVSPGIARDYVYIDDAVEAFLAAASAPEREPGEIYNVGSGRQTSIGELVGLLKGSFGVADEPVWGSMPDRGWDTDVWVADPTKTRADLGWEAQTPVAEGLKKTMGWLQDPSMTEFYRARVHR